MKTLLYDELRALARRILEAPENEMSALQNDARVLYERLTVLRYTEGLVEELRQTMGEEALPPAEPDFLQQDDSPSPAFAVQECDESVEPAEGEYSAGAEVQESGVSVESTEQEVWEAGQTGESGEVIPGAAIPEEESSGGSTVVDEPENRAGDVVESCCDPSDVKEEEKNGEAQDSAHREEKRKKGDLQPSLFGDDLFTKELDFDPDEDIFEDLSRRVATDDPIVEAEDRRVQDVENDDPSAMKTESDLAVQSDEKLSEEEAATSAFFSFEVVKEDAPEKPEETAAESPKQEEPQPDMEQLKKAPETVVREPAVREQKEPLAAGIMQQEDAKDGAEENEYSYMPMEDIVEAVEAPTVNEAIARSSGQQPGRSLNDILSASHVTIELNDRIAFVEHLFDGDPDAFEASVKYIFSLTSIDVANEYIIEILKPSYNNWFEKEKYERRFSEIVLAHFSQKG